MAFRVLIIGGTGQVGSAVVRALSAEPSCAEVVMVNRKTISLDANPRVRQVIMDTAASEFSNAVAKLAESIVAQGDAVYGASCVGVGQGSAKWSEEELTALEVGVVGGFCAWLSRRRHHEIRSALRSGQYSQEQDPLRADDGVEGRNRSSGRLQAPRHFPSGHHRRQRPYASLCCVVGTCDSRSIRNDRAGRHRARVCRGIRRQFGA